MNNPTVGQGDADDPATSSFVRWVAASALANFLGVAPMYFVGALAVHMQEDLGFGPAKLGIAVAVHRLATAALLPTLGRIVDRLGAARSLRIFAMSSAVTFLVIAFVVQSWGMLVVAMVMGGAGQSISSPAANRLVARNIGPAKLGRAFGFKQAGAPLSTTAAGLSVPLVAVTLGWRAAFLLAIVVSVGLLSLIRAADDQAEPDGPERSPHGDEPSIDGRPGQRASISPLDRWRARRAMQRSAGPLDRFAVIVQLSVAFGFATAVSGMVASFYILSAVEAGGDAGTAGFVLAASSVLAISVRILGGVWTDRRTTDHLKGCAFLLLCGGVGMVLIGLGTPVWMAAGALLTMAGAWGFHGIFLYALMRAYPQAPGRITGLVTPGAMLGSSVGQVLFGAALQFFNASPSWIGASSIAFIAAWLMLRLNPYLNHRIATQAP